MCKIDSKFRSNIEIKNITSKAKTREICFHFHNFINSPYGHSSSTTSSWFVLFVHCRMMKQALPPQNTQNLEAPMRKTTTKESAMISVSKSKFMSIRLDKKIWNNKGEKHIFTHMRKKDKRRATPCDKKLQCLGLKITHDVLIICFEFQIGRSQEAYQ